MDYARFLEKKPIVHSFFDQNTHTITHVVADPATRIAAVIDSVLDYEPHGAKLSHEHADRVVELIEREGYSVAWILETHAHADHVTAAQYLKTRLGGKVAIGERITEVQRAFAKAFHFAPSFAEDGSQFDHLWKDNEEFSIGTLPAKVIATPGHTPADVAYVIGDSVFVGDAIFMPDYGTARCDFPGGDAKTLYESIHRLYALPGSMRTFLCHDYLPESRNHHKWETTIEEARRENVHIAESVAMEDFVRMREARDATLTMPRLIIPSLQINIAAGHLPKPEDDGVVCLKIPVNSAFAG